MSSARTASFRPLRQMNLHAQLDGLFATLKGLPSSVEATTTPHLQMTQDEGFKISMIGDSTMVVGSSPLTKWTILVTSSPIEGKCHKYLARSL